MEELRIGVTPPNAEAEAIGGPHGAGVAFDGDYPVSTRGAPLPCRHTSRSSGTFRPDGRRESRSIAHRRPRCSRFLLCGTTRTARRAPRHCSHLPRILRCCNDAKRALYRQMVPLAPPIAAGCRRLIGATGRSVPGISGRPCAHESQAPRKELFWIGVFLRPDTISYVGWPSPPATSYARQTLWL